MFRRIIPKTELSMKTIYEFSVRRDKLVPKNRLEEKIIPKPKVQSKFNAEAHNSSNSINF